MRARRTVVVMGALAAAAALAGCSVERGMVAEVDGRTITEADLDRVSEELGPYLQDASRGAVLSALVQSEAGAALGDLEDLEDLEVTDEEAGDFLDDLAERAGVEPAEWGPGSLTIARAQLQLQALSEGSGAEAAVAQLQEVLADAAVTVNPRYGEYDPTTGAVTALQPVWIVAPVADAQPEAE